MALYVGNYDSIERLVAADGTLELNMNIIYDAMKP
jgi:hypothetical protein